jgi:hypothetical protein
MEEVLYLIHSTDKEINIKEIKELKPSKIEKAEEQYPAVYFSLITNKNIKTEPLYSYKNILIFSKKLLEQRNYHINIRDYNGWINENNTYFSWELEKAVKKINSFQNRIGNEVVFHDGISIKFLIRYIKCGSNKELPNEIEENKMEADMSKIPFYCIPYENNYTGIEKIEISSKEFYKRMGRMCLIENIEDKTREEIIELIKKNINKYYKKRELLDIKQMYR